MENKRPMIKTDRSEMALCTGTNGNAFTGDIRGFGALNDNLYEVINDTIETWTSENENHTYNGLVKTLL